MAVRGGERGCRATSRLGLAPPDLSPRPACPRVGLGCPALCRVREEDGKVRQWAVPWPCKRSGHSLPRPRREPEIRHKFTPAPPPPKRTGALSPAGLGVASVPESWLTLRLQAGDRSPGRICPRERCWAGVSARSFGSGAAGCPIGHVPRRGGSAIGSVVVVTDVTHWVSLSKGRSELWPRWLWSAVAQWPGVSSVT